MVNVFYLEHELYSCCFKILVSMIVGTGSCTVIWSTRTGICKQQLLSGVKRTRMRRGGVKWSDELFDEANAENQRYSSFAVEISWASYSAELQKAICLSLAMCQQRKALSGRMFFEVIAFIRSTRWQNMFCHCFLRCFAFLSFTTLQRIHSNSCDVYPALLQLVTLLSYVLFFLERVVQISNRYCALSL